MTRNTLSERIRNCAQPYEAPDNKVLSTISLQDRDAIAAEAGLSKKDVEIAALEANVIPRRYLRNIGSLECRGQIKVLNAKALLVGAGGLGGTVAQLLARMGWGTLVIADGDSFSEDNLNRQAFSLETNTGRSKVEIAKSSLAQINASTEVEIYEGYLAEKELAPLTKGVNVAIDALDNMPSRFALEKVCKEARIPLVHGAVAGFSGQVMVIYPEDPGLQAIYGDFRSAPKKGIETELGNLAGIVSTVASLQVQEVLKIVTGLGQPLRKRLLFIDSLNGVVEMIILR